MVLPTKFLGDQMQTITVKVTSGLIKELDRLVKKGWYANRSEAIREGMREVIDRRKYLAMKKAVEEDIEWAKHAR